LDVSDYYQVTGSRAARGVVRTLSQQEELPLLRDHLLRLDHQSRHDRFHGYMDDSFIERYAAKCASDGTLIIAFLMDGVVRGAAELHPPGTSPDLQPEVAFSVETGLRRQGVGSVLFRKLIDVARAKGYRTLRITTGAQNDAMRALANKFGAHLTFRYGESTGTIELEEQPWSEAVRSAAPVRSGALTPIDAARAVMQYNRAYWKFLLGLYGWKIA
jgi:GNAT superfamily N-acetyltransferase